jgi:L-proline amide hydrolase
MLIDMTCTTQMVPFHGHETWVRITAPDDERPGALPLSSCTAALGWRTTT